jgi:predicted nicotinamide N-methyase
MPPAIDLEILRKRLLSRIQRSYVTTTEQVQVKNLSFPFTRIADPDRVLDQVAAEADRRERVTGQRQNDEHLHLPYWAELWDSAMGMAQVMARGGEDAGIGFVSASPRLRVPASSSPGITVLDLGCGMGLSGTVAAALGGRVLFADLETPALLFARLNSMPWRRRVRARRLNWRTDRLMERFDLILGADILYERAQWEYLEPFWRGHLNEGGTVMLGEPGRQTGEMFLPWIQERGWRLEVCEEAVVTRPKPIRILQLRLA